IYQVRSSVVADDDVAGGQVAVTQAVRHARRSNATQVRDDTLNIPAAPSLQHGRQRLQRLACFVNTVGDGTVLPGRAPNDLGEKFQDVFGAGSSDSRQGVAD